MLAKANLDVIKHGLAALILSGIVQRRADRLIFATAVFDDKRVNAAEVADATNAAALAHLRPVRRDRG